MTVGSWYSPTGTMAPRYDVNTPEGRSAAAGAGANTLARPRFYATDNGPVTLPSDFSDQDAQQWVEAYNKHIATLTQQLQATSGLQRRQIEAQIEDAKAGRDNAMKLGQLQAETSRYGVDSNRETQMAQLRQNQQQFDQTHGLDLQRYGLDVAKAYTEYASGPDKMFMLNDFEDALGRAGQGLGPRPYGATGAPTPRTYDDFSVLKNYGPGAMGTGAGGGSTPGTPPGATNANGGPATPTGTGSTVDPRVTAANAVMKAIPPSDGVGHDDNNWAVLGAIENIYRAGNPVAYQRLRPGQQQAFSAGLSRLRYNAPDAIAQLKRNAIGQGDPRSA